MCAGDGVILHFQQVRIVRCHFDAALSWNYGKERMRMEWSGCELIETVPGKVSGAPVFKNTRLPVRAVVENYDAFMSQGMTQDEAIAHTLECYPSIPGGADAIRTVVAYRFAHERQLQP